MTPEDAAVGASLVVLSLVTLSLSILVLRKYSMGKNSFLWWGAGLFLAFVTIMQEAFIYFGYWSQPLIQSYIFMVALLVGFLSIGSMSMVRNGWVRAVWLVYMILMSITTAYFSFTTSVSTSVVEKGVVTQALPLYDIISSTLVTAPAATVIIALALYSTYRTRRIGTLLIAAGATVLSVAGSLFALHSFPVALYYAEFVGILLLFLGFLDFPSGQGTTRETLHSA